MTIIIPTIIIDTREQLSLVFTGLPSKRGKLECGDYGIDGFSDLGHRRFIAERKSLPDLVGTFGKGRERFLREVELLTRYEFRALVIEARQEEVEAEAYQSAIAPSSVFSTLDALAVRANLHVYWCRDAKGAATQVENLVRMFARGIEKDYNRLLAASLPGPGTKGK